MHENNEQRERLLESMQRQCGDVVMKALADDRVIEIMRNSDGKVWLDVAGEGMKDTGVVMPAAKAEGMLLNSATLLGKDLHGENPIVEGEFPLDGSRLEGLVYPVVPSAVFAIRKKAKMVYTLQDYHKRGMLLPSDFARASAERDWRSACKSGLDYLLQSARHHENILVVGGTGSGKTTLANAMLAAIAEVTPNDRVIAIEDTMELQVPVRNHVLLRANEHTTMQRLLRATMRLRPDRIIVGEVRGGEAYTLLKAWNSGHPGGLATIHANSASDGLSKLAQYVYESADARSFSEDMIGRVIAAAVNTVVFIERTNGAPGRVVSEVCRVVGYQAGHYQLEPISFSPVEELSNVA